MQTMDDELHSYIAGEKVSSSDFTDVFDPYRNERVGRVFHASREHIQTALQTACDYQCELSRYERSEILNKARLEIEKRRDEFARRITAEAGLCLFEGRYEVGRALDVLRFASMEVLKDDGTVFSCDVSPGGKQRKIVTTRDPVNCAVAITPFNHPLNQVAHKLAPAIAAGAPMILKPSEKTPLSAIRLAEVLYQAGLPGPMLSVVLGPTSEVAKPLIEDERVEVVAFTGSVRVGKLVASQGGYKRKILELGGNDPLIILHDADLDLAVKLAAEGCYRNSGQRCTAVKRLLVDRRVVDEFTKRLIERTRNYPCGDPLAEETRVGTVIDEPAAIGLEAVLKEAVEAGARIRCGGQRTGALFQPTVVDQVPRGCRMVMEESFGPLAPIIEVEGLEDAIDLANGTAYGLSSGVVTDSLSAATEAGKRLRMGTVNINEVPGFRIESSPFGGIKDSGLGIKEGVIEAIKGYSHVKTFSMPW